MHQLDWDDNLAVDQRFAFHLRQQQFGRGFADRQVVLTDCHKGNRARKTAKNPHLMPEKMWNYNDL